MINNNTNNDSQNGVKYEMNWVPCKMQQIEIIGYEP